MTKMNNAMMFVFAAALAAMLVGCVADQLDTETEAEESGTLETGSDQAAPEAGPSPRATANPQEGLPPEELGAAASVDWRICWPVAGLYYDACGSSVRETMQSGTAIQYAGNYAWCGSEYRYYVINLWTGHHGWVRTGALC